jgi:hypothetical protein
MDSVVGLDCFIMIYDPNLQIFSYVDDRATYALLH